MIGRFFETLVEFAEFGIGAGAAMVCHGSGLEGEGGVVDFLEEPLKAGAKFVGIFCKVEDALLLVIDEGVLALICTLDKQQGGGYLCVGHLLLHQ